MPSASLDVLQTQKIDTEPAASHSGRFRGGREVEADRLREYTLGFLKGIYKGSFKGSYKGSLGFRGPQYSLIKEYSLNPKP